jgi:hypothetical protein
MNYYCGYGNKWHKYLHAEKLLSIFLQCSQWSFTLIGSLCEDLANNHHMKDTELSIEVTLTNK